MAGLMRGRAGRGDAPDRAVRRHATRPTPAQHAAVMVLLEAGGISLPVGALAELASYVIGKTGGDPAGALLKAAGVEAVEDG